MRAVSKLIAVVIIVAVAITISILYALWVSGIVGSTITRHFSKIDIYELSAFGKYVKITVVNKGSGDDSISHILVNDKPIKVKIVYDPENASSTLIVYPTAVDPSQNPIPIKAGQTLVMIGITSEKVVPGAMYEVTVLLTSGACFPKMLLIEKAFPIEHYLIKLIALTDAPEIKGCIRTNGNVSIWVNGKSKGTHTGGVLRNGAPRCTYDINLDESLKPGWNVIAIEYNVSGDPFFDFMLGIEYRPERNKEKWILPIIYDISERTWKSHIDYPGTEDWYKDINYNDTSWNVTILPIGAPAYWKTTYYNLEDGKTMFFRKIVYIPSKIDGVDVQSIEYAELRIASDDYANTWVNGNNVISDTTPHSANYWNYYANVTKYVNLGDNLIAVNVTDTGGDFYFYAELFVSARLSNGTVANFTIPHKYGIRYKVLNGGSPPSNWWTLNYNDTGWEKGFLPIGINIDQGLYKYRVDTYKNYIRILIRIKVYLDKIPLPINSAGHYTRKHTGYNGRLILFDPFEWTYSYWNLYDLDGDPRTVDDIILIGKNNQEGTLSNPPPAIYSGTPIIFHTNNITPSMYANHTANGWVTRSPIGVYINNNPQVRVNVSWTNLDTNSKDKFIMNPIDNAIPGLDIILFWEDLWKSPTSRTWSQPDGCAMIDHVVRVTWLDDGRVRIGVYRASGWYLHVFILGNGYVYYKPHGDNWGETTGGTPNPKNIWWWHEQATGYDVFIERGVPVAGYDYWISSSGYKVTIWYR